MDEHPITAIRNKKDSSLMVGINLVKQGKALGCMSAGNTGAFMMGSTMVLGRMAGITRPAAAIPIPTPEGNTLLLDAGAATDCTAADLVNFAVCGHTYARQLWNVEKPRIALLSIGEEESKGSKQARTAHKLLKESDLNFIGNVQGTDIGRSVCDVMVCDGFTGNVALKVAEGMAMLIMQIVKDELGSAAGMEKLAALMLRPLMRRIKKRLDWQEVGGGPMLGIAGNVVIAHGKSRHKAVASAIRLTYDLARTNLLSELELALKTHHDMSQAAEQMNGVSV
jgi:glycerol-3-phosphate acyltransferase PlsX